MLTLVTNQPFVFKDSIEYLLNHYKFMHNELSKVTSFTRAIYYQHVQVLSTTLLEIDQKSALVYKLPTCVGLTNYASRYRSKECIGTYITNMCRFHQLHFQILIKRVQWFICQKNVITPMEEYYFLVKLQANVCNSTKSNTPP